LVLYNGDAIPDGCERADVRMYAAPFTEIADHLGSAKATNIAVLGAFLQALDPVEEQFILGALRKKVKAQKWFDLDVAALAAGREQIRA
jgi:Pyruvate/2-oxoacid:ferredoxin oxidoreductase gamma subunit